MQNRPGLDRLQTRIGTHGSFFEAMVERLSGEDNKRLGALTTRRLDDPSIALLDAWAVVADVLTFYQERIANEAYLRTATERHSLVEIAGLVGYRPRPGVSATAHLAFTLENETDPAKIDAGTRVNSVPGPGEKMVTFETSEAITARREWNAIQPRLTRPQIAQDFDLQGGLYVKGTKTRLKANDPVLIQLGNAEPKLIFVRSVVEDADQDRTFVALADPAPPPPPPEPLPELELLAAALPQREKPSVFGISIANLSRARAVAPPNSAALSRSVDTSFAVRADTLPRLLSSVEPAIRATLYGALRNALPPALPSDQFVRLYAMRVNARPFGHNAPFKLTDVSEGVPTFGEWQLDLSDGPDVDRTPDPEVAPGHSRRKLYLDNEYDVPLGSMVAIEKPDSDAMLLGAKEFRAISTSLHAYGMSGKSVLLLIKDDRGWLDGNDTFASIRGTRVFAGSEKLELAEAPITDDISADQIELNGVYDGLDAGRWLIIEGERADIQGKDGTPVPGVRAAELVMLEGIEQRSDWSEPVLLQGDGTPPPKDRLRTFLKLAAQADGGTGLAYRYKRDTVCIFANVARATNGETRAEILGNGDASASLQTFALKQSPLTRVTAATPSGTTSTLEVRVNELLWREKPSIAGLGPTDRCYVTRDDDDGFTSIIFGNGVHGVRPPSGRENVKASYRSGIGRSGNVPAGRLSLLATRPLGVKGVINPLPSSGGANREGLSSIRRNASIALMALDRLVSTPDYANFARAFGGVGKANATRGEREVEVVIAGVDDSPIGADAEILSNLAVALQRYGDPQVIVRVVERTRLALVIQVNVLVDADHQWVLVEPKVRAALLAEFAFERIDLGESLLLARALKAIQAVEGVVYADVDVFDCLSDDNLVHDINREPGNDTGLSRKDLIKVKPNQIAYLAPEVPDTLILREMQA